MALRLLAGRAYSEQELRIKLLQRGYASYDVNCVVMELRERGYLDDAALCRFLLDKYRRAGKYGKQAIFSKLRQRGLPAKIVDEAAVSFDYYEEWEYAVKLIRRRFGEDYSDSTAIIRYLGAKGFSRAAILQALRHVLQNTDF
ncbi:regulatory protein RecX [Sporolituus thermophilus]|uniref:Regulatory protein RecX n=1 Tax=Sporolituus thermophilus DSM 23256 TaxID=1123285 RepID=A0A1G7NQB8_9FIRM|nr:regulatory protein RecX [Sporolituus thermophilus]SDF76163.1 regulatory protein [Sporolituus thermophilus DSM 23256]